MKYLFTLLLIVSLNVFSEISADWFLIDKKDNGQEIYLNYESVEIDGTKRRFWILVNVPQNEQTISEQSINSYLEIDCKKKTVSILQATIYSERDRKGKAIATETDYKPAYIAPDTINDVLMYYACGFN